MHEAATAAAKLHHHDASCQRRQAHAALRQPAAAGFVMHSSPVHPSPKHLVPVCAVVGRFSSGHCYSGYCLGPAEHFAASMYPSQATVEVASIGRCRPNPSGMLSHPAFTWIFAHISSD